MRPKIKQSHQTRSGFYALRHDLLENSQGATLTYTSLLLPSAVAILAQTSDGLYILNREYRHPTEQILLGPPGGRLDPGEDPVEGARRELFEETGYWSDEIEIVGSAHPFPGICDQKIFYVWAKNAYPKSKQNLEPFEFIEVELKSDTELRAELKKGVNIDGNLCIALWFKDHYR